MKTEHLLLGVIIVGGGVFLWKQRPTPMVMGPVPTGHAFAGPGFAGPGFREPVPVEVAPPAPDLVGEFLGGIGPAIAWLGEVGAAIGGTIWDIFT